VYQEHNLRTWERRVHFLDTSPQQQTAGTFTKFLDSVPDGKSWFFWMNYSDPHHPWDKDASAVDPAHIQIPSSLPDLPGVRDDLSRYCGEIERADGWFGETENVLRRRNLVEKTIVVFMGDNGMAFPHGKGSLYDPGLNVPLIVRWPGKVKAGAKTNALVSGEDLAPTLLQAAGVEPHKDMSGRSFLGLLTGDDGYRRRPHIFAARLHHGNAPITEKTKASTWDLSRCVRSERYKLIYNATPFMEYSPVDSASGPGWQAMVAANQNGTLNPEFKQAYFGKRPVFELYDLQSDPAELRNLAGRPELAEVQRTLTAALQEKMILDYDFVQPPVAG
jgi:arylsulfatase A-like enzyme